MNSFPADDVISACHEMAPLLKVPEGIDSFKVMVAIGAVESGGADPKFIGHNCGPRYEKSYDVGGYSYEHSIDVRSLVTRFGKAAACSYGPWQMMFVNFPSTEPEELETNLDLCASGFVKFFNSYVIGVRHPQTLDEIAEVWNLGHIGSDPDYVTKFHKALNLI